MVNNKTNICPESAELHNKSQGHWPSCSGEEFNAGYNVRGGHFGHITKTILQIPKESIYTV